MTTTTTRLLPDGNATLFYQTATHSHFMQTDSGYDVNGIGVNNAEASQGAERLVELIESDVVP